MNVMTAIDLYYLPWFWHLPVEIVLEPPSFANDVDQMPGHTEKV